MAAGRVLATLTASYLAPTFHDFADGSELLTYVPLHNTKKRRRGFNQSENIAGILGYRLDLKPMSCLQRIKPGQDQKSLNIRQRRDNLKGAFKVTADVRGRRVILIDDVVTTLATVDVLSKLLLDAGADDVVIMALGRTPHPL